MNEQTTGEPDFERLWLEACLHLLKTSAKLYELAKNGWDYVDAMRAKRFLEETLGQGVTADDIEEVLR